MTFVQQTMTLKVDDLYPKIRASLRSHIGPIDLTDATVAFTMALEDEPTNPKIDNVACTIIGDEEDGIVEYTWVTGDTDEAGTYDAEFTVTYSDDTIQTFPVESYLQIVIVERLGS